MSYNAAGNMPSLGKILIPQRQPSIKRLELPDVMWKKIALVCVFGLLLILVAVICAKSSSPVVPTLLLGALGAAVIAMLYPSVALFLVFVGAGLPSLVVSLSFHTLRSIELVLAFCLLIIILRRPSMRLRLPHMLALLFIGIAIASFIHVPEISASVNVDAADKGLFNLLLLVLAFFCGTFLVSYIKNMSAFLVAVLLGSIPLYLIGLAQALGIHVSTLLEDSAAQDPTQSGGRLWGPFDGAATFGSYLVNLFAIALVCWLFGTRRRDRIIGAVMTTATALEIVGSGTRSAAFAAVVITIIALIVTRRYTLLLTTVVVSSVTAMLFLDKLVSKFAHSDVSTSNRIFLWQEALKLISQHPLLGIGIDQFHTYYEKLIISQGTLLNPDGISIHNQYLEYAMESGILWLVVGFLLLLSIIYFCTKAYRRAQHTEKALLCGAILAVLANMIICFVDVPLEKTEGGVFLFLVAGLALGYVERIRQRTVTTQSMLAHVSLAPSAVGVQATSATGGTALYKPEKSVRRWQTPPPILEDTDTAPSAQKTGRSVILQLLSWGISVIIIFPPTALLTRYLGPVQYGEYSFTFPFLAIFALLSGTGMDPLIVRKLSKHKRSEWSDILSYAAGTRILSTLAASVIAVVTIFLLPAAVEQRNLLLLGSLSLIFSFSFNGLRTIYECGYWAEQRMGLPSSLEAINRIGTAALIAFAVFLRLPLLWAYILIIYSDVPFFIILVILARRRFHLKLRFSLTYVREYFVGSLPLTGHNALTLFANQANVILLLPLAGSLSVGIYALAQRVTNPLFSIALAFVIGVYPLLCSKFEEGREQFVSLFNDSMRLVALCIIPLAIFVSVEAKSIVALLGGAQFEAAVTATQLLMWAMAATFFNQLTVRCCMAANKEHSIPVVTGISLTINILANILLIPHWQATGAGVAALLSQVISLCLFSLLLKRHVQLLHTLGILLRVSLGCLPAFVIIFWFQHAHMLLLAPVFGILVVGGCVLTRTLSLNDVAMARQLLSARKNKKPSKEHIEHPTTNNLEDLDIADQPTLIVPLIRM